jgi:membrane protein DedA with SNARE-associated domain
VPEGLDWERLVVTYPLPALVVAAVGGFLLGRSHGRAVLAAVSSYAGAQVAENFNQLLGRELG